MQGNFPFRYKSVNTKGVVWENNNTEKVERCECSKKGEDFFCIFLTTKYVSDRKNYLEEFFTLTAKIVGSPADGDAPL